jgi:hypothetical protein
MNRWAWIVFVIGGLGLAGWAVVGLQGLRVGAAAEPLALHTLLALVATLALVLAELWVIVFLLACVRNVAALGVRGDEVDGLRRDARRALALGLAAVVAALALFAGTSALYPGRLSPALHLATSLAATALQLAFFAFARRALRRQRQGFAALAERARAGDAAAAAC